MLTTRLVSALENRSIHLRGAMAPLLSTTTTATTTTTTVASLATHTVNYSSGSNTNTNRNVDEVIGEVKSTAKSALEVVQRAAAMADPTMNLLTNDSATDPEVAAEIRLASAAAGVNPLSLVGEELKILGGSIKQLIQSEHPMLDSVAKYYFNTEGKKIRPALVLLVARATAGTSLRDAAVLEKSASGSGGGGSGSGGGGGSGSSSGGIGGSGLEPSSAALHDQLSSALGGGVGQTSQTGGLDESAFASAAAVAAAAAAANGGGSGASVDGVSVSQSEAASGSDAYVHPRQRRLADITEMIHTASLVHDDVIDLADSRRGQLSVNHEFGNKMAVLGGDFLLARASLALARLRDAEVIELLSTVIAHLVEGEFLQLQPLVSEGTGVDFDLYRRKTFLKTASLMAYSCKAAVLLGPDASSAHEGSAERAAAVAIADQAFEYGKHLGLAFQFIDDCLDFVGTDASLGKPAGADVGLGIATAPVLFAAEEYPELIPLIRRQFSEQGDTDKALELVAKSSGVARTQELAQKHCQQAAAAVLNWPETPARQALVALTEKLKARTR